MLMCFKVSVPYFLYFLCLVALLCSEKKRIAGSRAVYDITVRLYLKKSPSVIYVYYCTAVFKKNPAFL
jgi:hypothetical protein